MGKHGRGLGRWWWLGTLIAISTLALVLVWRGGRPSDGARQGAGGVVRRETRPTLDPARFVGKARVTHQIARDIPDVLDRLYCYCECDKTIGHKSLLSCFTDGHAAT